MKKLFSYLLVFAMLLSMNMTDTSIVHAEDSADAGVEVTYSTKIDLSDSGTVPDGYAFHGNHQNRIVHTSHGEYAAYLTDGAQTTQSTYKTDEWSLIRTDLETGETEVIFQEYKPDESSQVSLVVDNEENVWAVTIHSDRYMDQFNGRREGIVYKAFCMDAETKEVTGYSTIINAGGGNDGYGYSSPFYDAVNNRIVCATAGGDYEEGKDDAASINWAVFDIETGTWSDRIYHQEIPYRECYMFGFADDGGLLLMVNRAIKATSVGFPEIGHDVGLTEEDRDYMYDNKIFRWSANYVWDRLELFYIPDYYDDSVMYQKQAVVGDYSHLESQTEEERFSFEGRMNNYYPNVMANNGGDFLWTTSEDGKNLVHIIYNYGLGQNAMDRSVAQSSIWSHQVWDVTDPANMTKLYDEPLTINGEVQDTVPLEMGLSFRFYQATDGTMYIVSGRDQNNEVYRYKDGSERVDKRYDAEIHIYQVREDGEGGYDYIELPGVCTLENTGSLLHIASHRSNSTIDDKISILYANGDGGPNHYCVVQATLNYDVHEHNYDEWVSTDEAKATHIYKCECGKTIEEACVGKEATSTADVTCIKCGHRIAGTGLPESSTGNSSASTSTSTTTDATAGATATGDESNVGVWMAVMIAAMAMLCGAGYIVFRKKDFFHK